MKKASALFRVKVYEYAICGNHIHILIKGPDRESIQNFFRVFAGHTAQRILKICPPPPSAGGARSLREGAPEAITGCKKNQRKFWSYLLYSRIVSWGREFKTVRQYIQKNTLEALHLIAYQKRTKKGKNKYANSS